MPRFSLLGNSYRYWHCVKISENNTFFFAANVTLCNILTITLKDRLCVSYTLWVNQLWILWIFFIFKWQFEADLMVSLRVLRWPFSLLISKWTILQRTLSFELDQINIMSRYSVHSFDFYCFTNFAKTLICSRWFLYGMNHNVNFQFTPW